jgi:hypothetical protein
VRMQIDAGGFGNGGHPPSIRQEGPGFLPSPLVD